MGKSGRTQKRKTTQTKQQQALFKNGRSLHSNPTQPLFCASASTLSSSSSSSTMSTTTKAPTLQDFPFQESLRQSLALELEATVLICKRLEEVVEIMHESQTTAESESNRRKSTDYPKDRQLRTRKSLNINDTESSSSDSDGDQFENVLQDVVIAIGRQTILITAQLKAQQHTNTANSTLAVMTSVGLLLKEIADSDCASNVQRSLLQGKCLIEIQKIQARTAAINSSIAEIDRCVASVVAMTKDVEKHRVARELAEQRVKRTEAKCNELLAQCSNLQSRVSASEIRCRNAFAELADMCRKSLADPAAESTILLQLLLLNSDAHQQQTHHHNHSSQQQLQHYNYHNSSNNFNNSNNNMNASVNDLSMSTMSLTSSQYASHNHMTQSKLEESRYDSSGMGGSMVAGLEDSLYFETHTLHQIAQARDRSMTGDTDSVYSVAPALGKLATLWMPNEMSSKCIMCCKSFSLVRRKHHCRNCGRLVCNECSRARSAIDGLPGGPHRVCDQCVEDYPEIQKTARNVPGYVSRRNSGKT